jgi:hypothetical protein
LDMLITYQMQYLKYPTQFCMLMILTW